jgi:hypothetical protein
MKQNLFARKYSAALESLIGRPLISRVGLPLAQLIACERRLKLRLPAALKSYYQLAGKLPINTEHNRLYPPRSLGIKNGKVVFMEENQAVVFWGIDVRELKGSDPTVYQANNEREIAWYPEELGFSDWII